MTEMVCTAYEKDWKNNPKAEQIRTDNQYRTMWNQTVDRALISGVPEEQILEVKQSEIGQKVKGFHSEVREKSGTVQKPDYDGDICLGAF
ncbi:hypothetical protein [Gallintestinimicrobium sp.]|uniref:hypothetical protein n=1 Tax=Gallintestinimicrobium sp. TaxID=2981655 RepID=UPI003992ABAA